MNNQSFGEGAATGCVPCAGPLGSRGHNCTRANRIDPRGRTATRETERSASGTNYGVATGVGSGLGVELSLNVDPAAWMRKSANSAELNGSV